MAEKKALIRFLIIYILSTILLVGVSEYFYYKISYEHIIEKEILEMKNRLQQNIKNRSFNEDVTIFVNQNRINGDSDYFDKDYIIKNGFIFYRYEKITRIKKIEFIIKKKLDYKAIDKLKHQLLIFNIFVLFFIFVTALTLGKIFIAPMKKQIQDLENFIIDTTHEINTPISIINSNIELLEMKNIEFKEFNRIKSATDRINTIFENMKFLYLKSFEIEKIDLKELILNRIEFFDYNFEQKDLKKEILLENRVLNISKEEAVRIVDNLLSNAIKYSPENSVIKIELNKNYFVIENRGEIKNSQKIMQKFVRENSEEGGFGIGLWIVETICKKYGFKFKIYSENGEVKSLIDFE